MPAYVEQLLREFVDRESEMERFRQLLDDPGKSVLALWGEGGIGKSSLLAKMMHEVAQRGLLKSEIVWTESRNHDYLAIMRKVRDDLGVEFFGGFTDLANYFTVPEYKLTINILGGAGVSVAEGMQLREGSRAGDVGGVVIKDLMLNNPRSDKEIPLAERITRLTDAFLPCFLQVTRQQTCVVFLDAAEKMAPETESWLWCDFLAALRNAPDEARPKFVVCGRREPSVDRSWRPIAEVRQLKPLTECHVVEYLAKRGVVEAQGELARMLLIATGGNMFRLANLVDAYLEDAD